MPATHLTLQRLILLPPWTGLHPYSPQVSKILGAFFTKGKIYMITVDFFLIFSVRCQKLGWAKPSIDIVRNFKDLLHGSLLKQSHSATARMALLLWSR